MVIWEFTNFSDEDLEEIHDAALVLNSFGIEQDEDMMVEIKKEQRKRAEEAY